MPTPLCNAEVTLERFPGKGGWTYAVLPASVNIKASSFSMVRVNGQIDDLQLENVALMALGKGRLFIPVKAALRQQLGKQSGDTVRLVLHLAADTVAAPLSITDEELRACLADVPHALAAYEQLEPTQQAAWVTWVAAAPTDDQKVARVEVACFRLANGGGEPPIKA